MQDKLDADFVRGSYNEMLGSLKGTYAAHRWRDTPVARAHYVQTHRALLFLLGRGHFARVLEVGGGDGVWTELVLPRADALDFVDISDEMIARAKERLAKYSNVQYMRADFEGAAIDAGAYDLALSVRNLEYMPDKRAVIEKYARALKRGGRLVIVTKNPDFKRLGSVSRKTLHTAQIEIQELVLLFAAAGLSRIDVRPAIIGLGLKYAPLRIVWSYAQTALLSLPRALVPTIFLKLFCESVVVSAVKS